MVYGNIFGLIVFVHIYPTPCNFVCRSVCWSQKYEQNACVPCVCVHSMLTRKTVQLIFWFAILCFRTVSSVCKVWAIKTKLRNYRDSATGGLLHQHTHTRTSINGSKARHCRLLHAFVFIFPHFPLCAPIVAFSCWNTPRHCCCHHIFQVRMDEFAYAHSPAPQIHWSVGLFWVVLALPPPALAPSTVHLFFLDMVFRRCVTVRPVRPLAMQSIWKSWARAMYVRQQKLLDEPKNSRRMSNKQVINKQLIERNWNFFAEFSAMCVCACVYPPHFCFLSFFVISLTTSPYLMQMRKEKLLAQWANRLIDARKKWRKIINTKLQWRTTAVPVDFTSALDPKSNESRNWANRMNLDAWTRPIDSRHKNTNTNAWWNRIKRSLQIKWLYNFCFMTQNEKDCVQWRNETKVFEITWALRAGVVYVRVRPGRGGRDKNLFGYRFLKSFVYFVENCEWTIRHIDTMDDMNVQVVWVDAIDASAIKSAECDIHSKSEVNIIQCQRLIVWPERMADWLSFMAHMCTLDGCYRCGTR